MPDAKRQKILAAILAVVGEQGYERASVQAVLDRAGLYRQAFYDHFTSKEDCFAAAYEEAATAVEAQVRTAAGGGRSWEEQLRAGLGRLLELLDDDPVLGRALLVEVHPTRGGFPGIHSVLHALLANGRGGLRELRGELMYVAVLPYRGADAAAAMAAG